MRAFAALLALALVLVAAIPPEARARAANPAERLADQPLDPIAYDVAAGCLHRVQPGTGRLEAWLARNRPRGSSWGTESCRSIPVSSTRIEAWEACRRAHARERDPVEPVERACPTPRPNPSLHAEGRALDWRLDAGVRADRREGDRLVALLLGPDSTGAANALARRMGLQEIIWNCRAWYAGREDMGPYSVCFDGRGRRRAGVDRTLAHRDHVHLGLNWSGARARTSFWRAGGG
jgi:hypothetical protein